MREKGKERERVRERRREQSERGDDEKTLEKEKLRRVSFARNHFSDSSRYEDEGEEARGRGGGKEREKARRIGNGRKTGERERKTAAG